MGLKKCVETGEDVWDGGCVWEGKACGGEWVEEYGAEMCEVEKV